jgi:hypothetical protein
MLIRAGPGARKPGDHGLRMRPGQHRPPATRRRAGGELGPVHREQCLLHPSAGRPQLTRRHRPQHQAVHPHHRLPGLIDRQEPHSAALARRDPHPQHRRAASLHPDPGPGERQHLPAAIRSPGQADRVQPRVQQGRMHTERTGVLRWPFRQTHLGENLLPPPPCRRQPAERRPVPVPALLQGRVVTPHRDRLRIRRWPSLLAQPGVVSLVGFGRRGRAQQCPAGVPTPLGRRAAK